MIRVLISFWRAAKNFVICKSNKFTCKVVLQNSQFAKISKCPPLLNCLMHSLVKFHATINQYRVPRPTPVCTNTLISHNAVSAMSFP